MHRVTPPIFQPGRSDGGAPVDKLLQHLLADLSGKLISVALIALSLLAFVVGQYHRDTDTPGLALPLQAMEGSMADSSLALDSVHDQLARAGRVDQLDTHLSRNSFWFDLSLSTVPQNADVLFLPSRDAMALNCWQWPGQRALGSADRARSSGALRQRGSGFTLDLTTVERSGELLCSARFRGPGRLTLEAWHEDAFRSAEIGHRETAATIEAGVGILAVFMLLTAWINRSTLYLTFAGWLLLSMRMAAVSAGTDFEFLGTPLPAPYLTSIRIWTVGLYYVMAVSLFSRLFEEDLAAIRAGLALRLQRLSALAIVLVCALLPFELSLRVIWVCTGLSIAVMLVYLVQILGNRRSRSAIWYTLAILLTVVANLNEVVAASTGHQFLLFGLNSVTAAIGSALFTCIAVAEHLRSDRLQRLAAQQALLTTYRNSPIGLFTVVDGERIVQNNPAFDRMLDDVAPSRRQSVAELFGERVSRAMRALLQPQAAGKASTDLETRISVTGETGDGARWFAIKASSSDGNSIEGSLEDITEKVQANEKLEFLVNHDPLTQCLNWRGMSRQLNDQPAPVAVAYLDLDRFKLINDLYGHAAGDSVLNQVCRRVRNQLGANDLLARIGGDEFLIAFQSSTMREAETRCHRLVDSVSSHPFIIGTRRFLLAVTGGLVETAHLGQVSMKEMVSAADSVCRLAKKRSSRLIVMERGSAFFENHQHELALIEQLEQGHTPPGLFLVMQPEISLVNPADSLNFEVLLRLRTDEGKVLPASMVIEAAEAHGKSALIDRWVVTTTIAWLEANAKRLPRTHFVGVNLSGGSLNDEGFIEELFSLFEQHQTALAMILLEITETVALKDMGNMQRFINRARALGAKVALDDFGAGYSSFGYLKHLSVDAIKLDGSLVRDAPTNSSGAAIIVALGGLVRGLGLRSIGEFAESLDIIKLLVAAGIDYAQGYAISKPVLPERILEVESPLDLIEDPEVLRFFQNIQEETVSTRELFLDLESEPQRPD